jgi:hypothetical protein
MHAQFCEKQHPDVRVFTSTICIQPMSRSSRKYEHTKPPNLNCGLWCENGLFTLESARIAILLTVPTGMLLVMVWCENGLFFFLFLSRHQQISNVKIISEVQTYRTPKSTLLVFHNMHCRLEHSCRRNSQHGFV